LDDSILVLFKDILATGGGSPWSVYKTALLSGTQSIFNTKGAKYLQRPTTTNQTVYFGDSTGNIYDLNGTGVGDNGSGIVVSRKTPLIDTSRLVIVRGNIQYRRLGELSCSLIFDWSNEYNSTQSDITLKGPSSVQTEVAYYNDDAYYENPETSNDRTDYYNEGFTFTGKVSKQNFSPAGRADGFFMTYYSESTVQFQVDNINLPGIEI
ncbi:unnamed protein product, partial [marine sediment metagenome]